MSASPLKSLWKEIEPWIRDLADLAFTVGISLVILRLLFGAQMIVPLVVVTSGSMTHDGSGQWMNWMEEHGLKEDKIKEFPLQNGFNMGDMLLVVYPEPRLGDVVIYERDLDHLYFEQKDPIIHRVVGVAYIEDGTYRGKKGTLSCLEPDDMQGFAKIITGCRTKKEKCPYPSLPENDTYRFLITKGDNNKMADICSKPQIAYPVNEAQVLGRGWIRLPYIGWLKILLNILLMPVRYILGLGA